MELHMIGLGRMGTRNPRKWNGSTAKSRLTKCVPFLCDGRSALLPYWISSSCRSSDRWVQESGTFNA